MSAINNRKQLDEFFNQKFIELHQYCTNPENVFIQNRVYELIQITNTSESFEFNCLGWEFVIKKEFYPFEGIGYLRTYEKVLDHKNYPHKELVPLFDMDIVLVLPFNRPDNFRFVKDNIQTEDFGRVGAPIQVPMNRAIIGNNFSMHYVGKLYNVLSELHKHK